MRRIVLILIGTWLFAEIWAQESELLFVDVSKPETQNLIFKPHYAGTSVNAGVMFMPKYGSALYVTPKLSFQATPRFFINAGISVIQYNIVSSQLKYESFPQQNITGAYIFTEGMYMINERLSVSGSVMKSITPETMRNTAPFSIPNEAVHFGVDYKVAPNITIGARIGYSNGGNNIYPY